MAKIINSNGKRKLLRVDVNLYYKHSEQKIIFIIGKKNYRNKNFWQK